MSKMSMIDALEKLAELNNYEDILVKTNASEPQLIENAIEDIQRNAEEPDEEFDLRVTRGVREVENERYDKRFTIIVPGSGIINARAKGY